MFTATAYLDTMYGDNQSERFPSRAQTPMQVIRAPASRTLLEQKLTNGTGL